MPSTKGLEGTGEDCIGRGGGEEKPCLQLGPLPRQHLEISSLENPV